MVGFRTSKGGAFEWSFDGEGGPLPSEGLGPVLSPAGGGVGSLLELLLLE